MPAAVEGGTPAQQRLMREILGGLGDTRIELIRLEDWVDDFEGEDPTPEEIEASRGTCVRLVEPDPAGYRADWEVRLVADAFEYRSADEGLPPVVWLQVGSQHGGIVSGWRRPPLDERSLEQLAADVRRAADEAGAEVEYLDIVRPDGHAWAVSLHVDEPHRFARQGFRQFREAVEHWSKLCAGRYLEVRDDGEHPVLMTANGVASVRRDLACCDPLGIYGRSLVSPPRPRCPVFGD
jgi:hypothetical protein